MALPGSTKPVDINDEKGKIFVGGLSWDTSVEGLLKYFSRYGEVIDCVVMKNTDTGKSRGFGFVTFRDPSCVLTVLSSGPHELDGRMVDPKACNPRSMNKVSAPRGGKNSEQNRMKKVFIGGLPTNITEPELREYFGQYGKVGDVVIMYDQQKKRSRGFGFVTFETEESVDRLCQLQFVNVNGKQVECKRAEPRELFRPLLPGLAGVFNTSGLLASLAQGSTAAPGLQLASPGAMLGMQGIPQTWSQAAQLPPSAFGLSAPSWTQAVVPQVQVSDSPPATAMVSQSTSPASSASPTYAIASPGTGLIYSSNGMGGGVPTGGMIPAQAYHHHHHHPPAPAPNPTPGSDPHAQMPPTPMQGVLGGYPGDMSSYGVAAAAARGVSVGGAGMAGSDMTASLSPTQQQQQHSALAQYTASITYAAAPGILPSPAGYPTDLSQLYTPGIGGFTGQGDALIPAAAAYSLQPAAGFGRIPTNHPAVIQGFHPYRR